MFNPLHLSGIRVPLVALAAASVLLLSGCKSEVYQGLSENQANAMMAVLMKHGIVPEKTSDKTGYTLAVENDQIVQTLDLMRENNLPRADYENMGQIFAAKGMISSSTEEQARLTYALSQELTETFSQIDGVLTARVHVVLGAQDLATGKETPPSAAVFLRHTPDSQVTHLVPRVRELAANAVPGLKQDNVSVMLVAVRETSTAPMNWTSVMGQDEALAQPLVQRLLMLSGVLFLLLLSGISGAVWYFMRLRKKSAEDGVQAKERASDKAAT